MIKELKRGAAVGTTFNRGLEIYKKNFVPLLVATILMGVIGGVTCGICSAPLCCGLFAMVLAAMRSNDAILNVGDVFKGFQKFVPSFVAFLAIGAINSVVSSILMVIPILGWIAVIVLGCAVVPAVMMWSLLLVADQNASIAWQNASIMVLFF